MVGKGGGRGFKGGGGGREGAGGSGGEGGGGNRRTPNHHQQNIRDKREEIKNFLGFYKRTDSVCIDLYQPEFFRRKPTWEEMAVFVSQQLCLSAPLKAALKDIQLHPVKKHLFLKFRDTLSRDQVAAKLKAGVEWPAFEAKVHGWAMDKPVIVVRLHGVSPESTKREIGEVMAQYGDVLDVDIGFISKKLLPGVTNGTWTVKMILQEDKALPSFVFMKEEGEVWQVTHENQVNVCWKCGMSGHVGARCNQPTLTFDALDGGQADIEEKIGGAGSVVRSWAHVVRSGSIQTVQNPVTQSDLELQENVSKFNKEQITRQELASALDKVLAGKDSTIQIVVDKAAVDSTAQAALTAAAVVDGAAVVVVGSSDVVSVEIAVADSVKPAGAAGVHETTRAAGVALTDEVDEEVNDMEIEEIVIDFDASEKVVLKDNSDVDSKTESVSVKVLKKGEKKIRLHKSPIASDTSSGEEPGDFDSMVTSKAGMSHYGSDFDASFPGQGSVQSQLKLKKINPGDSTSSGSSSDSSLPHKVAGGQDETGLSDDFPNNKRSVINREMKKDLRSDNISSDKDNDSDQDPGDQNQDQ